MFVISQAQRDEIERGIAAYSHDREVLLRLLRKRGQFTEREFDQWFRGREWRRSFKLSPRKISGDSFILGADINGGNLWAERLDLLRFMVVLGQVDAVTERGMIVYKRVLCG